MIRPVIWNKTLDINKDRSLTRDSLKKPEITNVMSVFSFGFISVEEPYDVYEVLRSGLRTQSLSFFSVMRAPDTKKPELAGEKRQKGFTSQRYATLCV